MYGAAVSYIIILDAAKATPKATGKKDRRQNIVAERSDTHHLTFLEALEELVD
jgi:hypothetical protein